MRRTEDEPILDRSLDVVLPSSGAKVVDAVSRPDPEGTTGKQRVHTETTGGCKILSASSFDGAQRAVNASATAAPLRT